MKEKSTSDLSEELMGHSDIDAYLKGNQALFCDQDIAGLLSAMFARQELTKAELARRAGMSEVYLHQVFSGRRNPSRDRLLCLCVGMGAALEDTQRLLQQASYAQLYPRIRRDAIIIHGILHQIDLDGINDKLFAENEKTLS